MEENQTEFYINSFPIRIDILECYEYLKKSDKIKNFIDLGIVSSTHSDRELLMLLSATPVSAFFRASDGMDDIINKLWLSKVIKKAIDLYSNNIDLNFDQTKINTQFIKKIAKYSKMPEDFKQVITNILRENGILLVYESHIKGSKIDGACLTLPNGIPVIGISLRFDRIDSFWFTLLHELAHIHLHYNYLNEPIIDDLELVVDSDNRIEIQANNLAKYSIVEKSDWRTFITECKSFSYNTNESNELKLKIISDRNEVHPALIAGLVRYELKNYTLFSELINSYKVRNYF
ncbi:MULTISPECIES: ImmA/IrrE family metallo-endopeptidase [Leptospira]|uniref:ImmA/IrrE family metallo-endopeptidase n=1 Tax=Leptospira interrogans TaxID=173 RepID=A0AAV9FMP7_LEPIR|nr:MULTISPECIES: ImmA/IrrE family metallo-endopeptidase [Leptospira]KAK2617209.1 ImmA/IrrE family metallo-endopeptidase [Leptospira interrogans]